MLLKRLSFFLLVGICYLNGQDITKISASEEFLTPPKVISEAEFVQNRQERTLEMGWHIEKEGYFRFITKQDEVYFELVFFEKFPEDFGDEERALFFEQQDRLIYSYHSANLTIDIPLIEEPDVANSFSYLVSERRIIPSAKPHLISEEELFSFIDQGNVLFYTGAGLSAASDVPTMDRLMSLVGFTSKKDLFPTLKSYLNKPEKLASSLYSFHQACFFNPATKAHLALKELALFKNTQIVTENLDNLHEQTGIKPYRIDASRLQIEVDPSSLKNIDCLICLGLSYDDRGFIGWYKKHHPQGKIIAIDLRVPSYLSDEDYLYQGDLQIAVPKMALKVGANSADSQINKELQQEILDMWQEFESALEGLRNPDASDEDFQAFARLKEKHNIRLKEIISTFGWPGINQVGIKVFSTMWRLIEQQDHDRELRKQLLKALKNNVEKQQAEHYINYAYLLDRVRQDENLPQVYGTVWLEKDGKHVLYPVEDPINLNQRRAELSLGTIEQFREAFFEVE